MTIACQRLLIIVALFLGLYLISQNFYFGSWIFTGHFWWLKWLVLAVVLWAVFGGNSSRPPRRRRCRYDADNYRFTSVDSRALQRRLDRLQTEIEELRQQRDRTDKTQYRNNLDAKLADLTERIVNLEKIVTDRRYQLDDELNKL